MNSSIFSFDFGFAFCRTTNQDSRRVAAGNCQDAICIQHLHMSISISIGPSAGKGADLWTVIFFYSVNQNARGCWTWSRRKHPWPSPQLTRKTRCRNKPREKISWGFWSRYWRMASYNGLDKSKRYFERGNESSRTLPAMSHNNKATINYMRPCCRTFCSDVKCCHRTSTLSTSCLASSHVALFFLAQSMWHLAYAI